MATAPSRLDSVRQDVERSIFRARNGIKYAAGIGRPKVGLTPKDLVWTRETTRLFRYRSDSPKRRRPLLIVWSLVTKSYVLDLLPGQSLIEQLLTAGTDVFLVDWAPPGPVDSTNTLETYVDNYLPAAVEAVMKISGTTDLDVCGYCFGGTMSLMSLAGHPGMPVANLVLIATPVDFAALEGLVAAVRNGAVDVADLVDDEGNVPADVIARGFELLQPTAKLFSYAVLWERLWNDSWVESYQAMGGWLNDQVPVPGGAMRQSADLLVRQNVLMDGDFRFGDRLLRLADVQCPVLNVIAEADHVVPPAASEVLPRLVGSADITELRIPAGHVGLATGRHMVRSTAPKIAEWLKERSA
jgi:polyhydroxyalkanoate synthase subunit PhaC